MMVLVASFFGQEIWWWTSEHWQCHWQMYLCFCLSIRVFCVCESVEVYVKNVFLVIVEDYAGQVLCSGSNLTANEERCIAARVSYVEKDGIQTQKNKHIWSAPIRAPREQTFSKHVVHFLTTMFLWAEGCGHMPWHHCSVLWRGRFHRSNSRAFQRWSLWYWASM